MIVCARADRNDFARAARRLKGACTRPAVTSRHGHHHAGIHRVLETNRKQIVVTMVAAAKRQIKNVHAVLNRCVDRIEDVLAAGVRHVAWKNIIISQPRTRGYPRHVINTNAVHHCGLAGHPRGVPGRMRPVVLYGLGVEALLVSFVVEHLGNDDLR